MLRLIARIKDAEVLTELIHEKGTCFFRPIPHFEEGKEVQPVEYEVVYFSGNRMIHFVGRLSEDQLKSVKGMGNKCSEIEIDFDMGEVMVIE